MDSLARSALLLISGRQAVTTTEGTRSATEWLMEMVFSPERADGRPVFLVDDPEVLGLLHIPLGRRRFAFNEIKDHLAEIEDQARAADRVPAPRRSRFERAVLNLSSRAALYQRLQNTLEVAGSRNAVRDLRAFETALAVAARQAEGRGGRVDSTVARYLDDAIGRYTFLARHAEFFVLPQFDAQGRLMWNALGQGILDRSTLDAYPPNVTAYAAMADAYRAGNLAAFDAALTDYHAWLATYFPRTLRRSRAETVFNAVQPFYKSLLLYIVVFLLIFLSWLTRPETPRRWALTTLGAAVTLHLAGLVARMVLQGRPPVTNLYSSAVFVGAVAVILGVVLESLHRNGVGALIASVIGFLTLLIAHHLAAQGDTLEMMRAVLDSNFWLATHVVAVTIGYGGAFLAGFLAVLFILRGVFTRSLSAEDGMSLHRMVYGVVCFSLFFSFVGTVLGGIWADQSWGRFWGWDPKENGALLIVLWNAGILHARWGKFVGRRGMMVMAVFGSVVTAFSWFGVNMLGIGLHSYGFMDKAFWWLLGFVLLQGVIMSFGGLPPLRWRSPQAFE
jgi:ABC-type transport system involved in cytochrome c biogenesis permease subunit